MNNNMPDGNSNSATTWVIAIAAIISAGVAVVALCQAKTLNAETALLQHTQHRISNCIAISQHHYATWEHGAVNDAVEDDVHLRINGETTDSDGKPILLSKNLERADKAIGLARQLALCSSSDPDKTHDCIEGIVTKDTDTKDTDTKDTDTKKSKWLVNDDNVGEGPQPREGSRNPVC
jgi:hypothetical protein